MISDLIQSVLQIQPGYSSSNTQKMQERRELIEYGLKSDFQELVQSLNRPVSYQVDASSGIGLSAKVPWVRISNKEQSPNARNGWYVVLLFSADGKSAALSLDLGVTRLKPAQVKQRREQAIEILGASADSGFVGNQIERFSKTIHLADPGLGARYEKGNIAAFVYETGLVPDTDSISTDLDWLLDRLEQLPSFPEEPESAEESLLSAEDGVRQLAEAISFTVNDTRDIIDSLTDSTPQIVLTGPPGTGKTFVAQRIAAYLLGQPENITDNPNISVVQFHPSYGYEEFVEGLRPTPSPNGGLEFQAVGGTLLKIVDEIDIDGQARVLILDEMNRANLARVFGELMFLLEYREQSINLLHRASFSLPKNLYIIGTMNTADRSAKSIDIALRRRFDFYELKPNVEVLKRFYSQPANTNNLGDELFEGFEALNSQVESLLGDRHYQIGHSYFMKPQMDKAVLRKIWNQQIQPLLEEYFFDRPEIVRDFLITTYWRNA